MQGKLDKKVYQEIYRMLDQATPVPYDCGQLCQKACCQDLTGGSGMYLLPGEEVMFSGQEDWLIWERHRAEDYDFPASWKGQVWFIRCDGSCPREKRPVQCRTFPLTPHLTGDQGYLIWETLDLPYRCPLIRESVDLSRDFIHAVASTWRLLLRDSLIRDLVKFDSRQRELDGAPVLIVSKL